jgi:hypothetical protein
MTEISLKKRFPDVRTAKLALARLGEPESIVREKPYGSKIVLTKSEDVIEIVIPDRRFPIGWGIAIMLSLFILPIPLTLITIYNFIYYFFGKLHLIIDGEQICFYKQIGNFRFGKQIPTSPRANIDNLTYNLKPQPRGNSKKPISTKEIVISAGVREYRIYSHSEAECEWLLAELSEWLHLVEVSE